MSLFSDVDWAILLLAAALLLMGGHGTEIFRTLGRLYGKYMRIRQELTLNFQSQLMAADVLGSAAAGPLPVVNAAEAPKPAVPVAPLSDATAASAPSASPPNAPTVAAAGGGPIHQVHRGSTFPQDGAEMFR